MTDDETNLQDYYRAAQQFASELIVKEGADALEVAAVMASMALTIYKTTLPEDAFNDIVDAISASREQVREIDVFQQHTVH
tara:strand:- start:291 stop:533 length:243 start_codon:yes stop_codon:yes gene_type:complete